MLAAQIYRWQSRSIPHFSPDLLISHNIKITDMWSQWLIISLQCSVLLGNLGSCYLTPTTHLNIVPDQAQLCHTANLLRNGSSNTTKPKMLTRPLNSPDPKPIRHLWDTLEQARIMEAPPCNPHDPKDPLLMSQCQTPQNTSSLCPSWSELFWWHKVNLHNIR